MANLVDFFYFGRLFRPKFFKFLHLILTSSTHPAIFVILKFVDPTLAMEYILHFMATRGTHACCHEIQNIFHRTRSTRGNECNAVKNYIVTWYK